MIELPWPPAKLSPNGTRNKFERHRLFQSYKGQVKAIASQFPAMREFKIEFFPPNNRPTRNIDNAIAAFKAGQDGLALAWKMDDSEFQVTYPRKFREVVKHG